MLNFHFKWLVFAAVLVLILPSCENDLKTVKAFSDPENGPDIKMINFETIYSDSAKIKGKLIAPLLDRYESNVKKYNEFPNGLHIYFYNDSLIVKAEILAKYAINYDNTQLWEARNDVVVINAKGERLNTEQLFWDQSKKIIYTKKYCRLTTPDGNQNVGENGMEANENFEHIKFFGAVGDLPVKNAEE